jgi:DNA-directed RNA polymerase subunit delta
MSDKMKSLSMLEIAEATLRDSKSPMTIQQLIKAITTTKGLDGDDVERLTQFYMDFTQSAKFVYCGDDLWDLKERNLELWDKDGHAFQSDEPVDDDIEEDLDFTEFVLEDTEDEEEKDTKSINDDDDEQEDVEEDEDIKEEKEYIEVELPIKSTDDDDVDEAEIEFDSDDYDEDDYNEIMDEFEDMYDDE